MYRRKEYGGSFEQASRLRADIDEVMEDYVTHLLAEAADLKSGARVAVLDDTLEHLQDCHRSLFLALRSIEEFLNYE